MGILNNYNNDYGEKMQEHYSTDEQVITSEESKEIQNVKLVMWNYKHCDPKRCSGVKLIKLGLCREMNTNHKTINLKFNGIILSPTGKKHVSKQDLDLISKYGIGVIDASWNRINEIDSRLLKKKNCRVLPWLVAANPAHYGKPFELNCVEAFSSALFIMGLANEAGHLLSKFSYGSEFIKLNEDALNFYEENAQTSLSLKQTE